MPLVSLSSLSVGVGESYGVVAHSIGITDKGGDCCFLFRSYCIDVFLANYFAMNVPSILFVLSGWICSSLECSEKASR